jgi:hypothetical protein
MNFKLHLTLPSLLLLFGCSAETTESKNVSTEAIWAEFKLTSDGNSVRVVAELNVDGSFGNNLKLSQGDKLYATVNGTSKDLEEDLDFLDIDYQAYFNETASRTTYSITLAREVSKQRLISTVQLPDNFRIYAPQDNQAFNYNDTNYISWQGLNSDKSIDIDYKLNCTSKQGGTFSASGQIKTVADNGNTGFAFHEIEALKETEINKTQPCYVTLFLTRKNEGIVDSKYKSGSRIYAQQTRKVSDLKVYF